MKLSSFAPIIVAMMRDKMDIYRQVERTNADDTTTMVFEETPRYSDVKCHLSFGSIDSPKDWEVDQNPVRFAPKIFCPSNADLKAGDRVVVRKYRDDGSVLAVYKGLSGLPADYPTHKEALINIKESA